MAEETEDKTIKTLEELLEIIGDEDFAIENTEDNFRVNITVLRDYVLSYADIKTPDFGFDKTGNQVISFPANSYLGTLYLFYESGSPTVKIGSSEGGEEYLPITSVSDIVELGINQFKLNSGNIYLTISDGNISFRLESKNNFKPLS